MRTEEVQRMADSALEELAAALDRGESEAMRNFLRTMSRFTGYSLGNQLLIMMQRPDATRVAGFHTWRRLGRAVRKGERGIHILAPIVRWTRTDREREAVADDVDGLAQPGSLTKPQRVVTSFRGAVVFDQNQTDGKALPEFAKVNGDPRNFIERLEAFVVERGIRVERSDLLGSVLGMSVGGTILIRPDLTPAETFAVLVHEAAHEFLHRDEEGKAVSRIVKEVEAEAVAFVVCQSIALDTNTAASDYVRLYNGDRSVLMASLNRIRAVAVEIMEGIKVKEVRALRPIETPLSQGVAA